MTRTPAASAGRIRRALILLRSVLAAGLLVVVGARPAAADSWAAPRTFDTPSVNGKFVARVVPAGPRGRDDGRPPARLSVYAADAGGKPAGPAVWSADLSNDDSPVTVLVTGDGRHAVTFDNWHRVGYGEDVVAFYGPAGQAKRYSLERLLETGKVPAKDLLRAVPHSVSSRWWRRPAVTFLDEPDGEQRPDAKRGGGGRGPTPRLCVWLGWAKRWLAWDAATGEPVEPTAEDVRRWNERARERMLAEAAKGKDKGDRPGAAAFLGWLADPRDHDLLERLRREDDGRGR